MLTPHANDNTVTSEALVLRDRREASVRGRSFFHIISYERRLVAAKRVVKLSRLVVVYTVILLPCQFPFPFPLPLITLDPTPINYLSRPSVNFNIHREQASHP